jgi:branched-chain amino acid transport system substrate-binding protein
MWNARGALLAAVTLVISTGTGHAEKLYDPGASDTSIKIGNTMPYSGPNSFFAVVGRTQAAYFKMINDQGGVNGRKIDYISYDDSYSPPKTVEQVRKLVESDEDCCCSTAFWARPPIWRRSNTSPPRRCRTF